MACVNITTIAVTRYNTLYDIAPLPRWRTARSGKGRRGIVLSGALPAN